MKLWWKETVRWDGQSPKKVTFVHPILTYTVFIAAFIIAGILAKTSFF